MRAELVRWIGPLVIVGLFAACGGPRFPDEFETQGAYGLEVEMGEDEEQARLWLEELGALLEGFVEEPEGAATIAQAWLVERAPAMRANTEALHRHMRDLPPQERLSWQNEFAAYLQDAHARWLEAREALVETHPELAREILEMIDEIPSSIETAPES